MFFIRKPLVGIVMGVVLVAALAFLAGCGVGNKASQPFRDAGRNGQNNNPAEVGTMPDGFNNWAAKCDGRNMVYTTYHGDSGYGSIAVVANDPRCRG